MTIYTADFIVDLYPLKKMIFHGYISLQEGNMFAGFLNLLDPMATVYLASYSQGMPRLRGTATLQRPSRSGNGKPVGPAVV